MFEHAFKLYKKIFDKRLNEVVDIDKMQCGFMPGRGTVDAVFVVRRLLKNSESKIRSCFLCLLIWKMPLIGCQGKLFVLL